MKRYDDRVAFIFNEMKEAYDEINDLWYAWLFCRLHWLIATRVMNTWKSAGDQYVLDIGCGTGFQSFLYASAGAKVAGIDIAEGLVQVAKQKLQAGRHIEAHDLFPAHFPFVTRYNEKIRRFLDQRFPERRFVDPSFEVGSALELPYDDGTFTHVNCCGSVLSFIEQHTTALDEIRRVLRPGGTFILEVEGKYNLDLLWMVVDAALLRGKLGYECTVKEAMRVLMAPRQSHVFIEYPFGEVRNPVYMNIKLFSRQGLKKDLSCRGLLARRWWSIHSITNVIPSTLLDSSAPSKRLLTLFSWLARLEEMMPICTPGCSLVVFGSKPQ